MMPVPTARLRKATCSRFVEDAKGSVTIEFIIIAPIILMLIFGTFELSKYLQTNNQVVQAAAMTGQMVSQLPGTAKVADVQKIWSAAPLIAPESLRVAARDGASDWSGVLDVTITSVVFKRTDPACLSECDYTANVAWSVGQSPRPCGTVDAAGPGDDPDRPGVPEELVRDGSAIMVQTALPYQPYLFGTSSFVPGVASALTTRMREVGWFQPRNASRIALSTPAASNPIHVLCPDFNT